MSQPGTSADWKKRGGLTGKAFSQPLSLTLAEKRRKVVGMNTESLERIMTSFRGDRSREVNREDFVDALADVLGLSLLRNAAQGGDKKKRPPIRNYSSNKSFWVDLFAGQHREGMSIRLEGFHIMEWTPSSPGRYFTSDAAKAREKAKEYVSYTGNEYLPLGKVNMMLGGVGSVRLKGRTLDGQRHYFLGATSTGISHQGIPIIVPESQYSSIVEILAQAGGCYSNIIGQLRVMPPELSLIAYERSVPKYAIFAQSIEVIERSPSNLLLATASVMYSGSYYDHYEGHGEVVEMDGFTSKLRKGWTFCSFNPAFGTGAITEAAKWLSDYAGRYGREGEDPVLSDFDELYQHFDSPVEFPLSNIIDGRVSMDRLQVYGQHYGFQIIAKEVTVGNIFSNITNSTIINESEVNDSFNKIVRDHDEETANALLRVAEEVNSSSNAEAGALFNSFNEELQKDESNKTVLKTLWDGLLGQLPNISTMVGIVEKISRLFS